MRRFLLFAGIGVAFILLVGWLTLYFMKKHTKSFSPEKEIVYTQGPYTFKVFYNRPSKLGREIFGGLVPYGKVWRTGANEATTFETSKNIKIDGQTLLAGKYSIWTIPNPETWTIIFNSEFGQWGINSSGEANREPERDVLTLEVPAVQHDKVIEQFTISFEKVGEDAEMVLLWDKTLVAIPITLTN